MRVFGLSDFHLHGFGENPMMKYSAVWQDHRQQIRDNILAQTTSEDILLAPGDLTLARDAASAQPDLDFLAELPCRIVLCKGNHDFWWQSMAKVKKLLPKNVFVVQNDAISLDGVAICGTRGWFNGSLKFPGVCSFVEAEEGGESKKAKWDAQRDNEAIYHREVGRLELALKALPADAAVSIALLHYPPTNLQGDATEMTALLERYQVQHCVFGHLHGPFVDTPRSPFCRKEGVAYHLVSSDYLGFKPQLILEL